MATETELTLTKNAQNDSNAGKSFNNVGDNLLQNNLISPETWGDNLLQNGQILSPNPPYPSIPTPPFSPPYVFHPEIPKDILEGHFLFSPPKIIEGTPGPDYINGDQGNDILSGNSGNDILLGNSGDDILQGQKGRDTLSGDDGNDWLDGGPGQDILTGGGGTDTFVLIGSLSAPNPDFADVIMDFQPGTDHILLSGVGGVSNVNITQGIGIYANDTILNMANTGQVLAILKGVTSTTLNISDLIFG